MYQTRSLMWSGSAYLKLIHKEPVILAPTALLPGPDPARRVATGVGRSPPLRPPKQVLPATARLRKSVSWWFSLYGGSSPETV
jgi:hypothetical protein